MHIDLPILSILAKNGNGSLVWLVTHKHNSDTPFYGDFNCITPNGQAAPCLEPMKMVMCLYSLGLSVDLLAIGDIKCVIDIYMKGQYLLIKLGGPQ